MLLSLAPEQLLDLRLEDLQRLLGESLAPSDADLTSKEQEKEKKGTSSHVHTFHTTSLYNNISSSVPPAGALRATRLRERGTNGSTAEMRQLRRQALSTVPTRTEDKTKMVLI